MTELSDELKTVIQEGYRKFLRHRNLKPRYGQRQMIGTIASTLGSADINENGELESDPALCVIEAGTGTGKTLGYLLSTLPVASSAGKKVVVATATVSLQSQLIDKDIPELLETTGWSYRFALAKGRGRYICNLRLERCLDAVDAQDAGLFLFEDEMPFNASSSNTEVVKHLESKLKEGVWSGDRDTWPEHIPDDIWRALTVDRRQCAGHRCRKFHDCAFFKARAELDDADCIIANHDLVMADLSLGGGAILPAPEQTIYVFDEAHRIGDTTLRHFGGSCRVASTIQWLEQMEKNLAQTAGVLASERSLVALLDEIHQDAHKALEALRQAQPLLFAILNEQLPDGVTHYRFPLGEVGDDVRDISVLLARQFIKLVSRLEDFSGTLEKAMDAYSKVPRVDLEQVQLGVGSWLSRAEAVAELWHQMAEKDKQGVPPNARWLAIGEHGQDVVVSVSPISAADLLMSAIWSRCFGAVLTSATLRALGKFDRFMAASGLPRHTLTMAVPGAFDFAKAGTLAIPDIGADGGNPHEHTTALIEHLGKLINPDEGTLVLFASRKQMEAVAAEVVIDSPHAILVQGNYSHGEIVRRHRERLDRGEGSVIFGLASFAEGLDLPGDYCRHVIIAKLPFSVPDDPLLAAQSEWLESQGLRPFQAMTLPDASLKLIQACGRLLRTEQDRGRVTILDRRLMTKFYGRQLLDSLPPFRREIQ